MTTTVTLIPGDGITRELVEPVKELVRAAGADIEFDLGAAGEDAYLAEGTPLPEATIESIRQTRIALKGKLKSRPSLPYASPNWELRRRLDLYAELLPLANLPGLPARHQDVDIVIVRQATEDTYGGHEHQVRDGLVSTLKVVTADASRRIATFAFEYARAHGRKKVTLVHKANIMKVTDGLFIEVTREVAKGYPDIELGTIILDNACMQLLMRPQQFDVLLMGNLYGGIMGDLGAGIVGGIAATAGISLNDDLRVFEAVHGDAPDLEGTGRANPLPLVMPTLHLLDYVGEHDARRRILAAVSGALEAGVATVDMGGTATTRELIDAIGSRL